MGYAVYGYTDKHKYSSGLSQQVAPSSHDIFETKSVGDYNQRIGDHARLQGFATGSTMQIAFSIVSAFVLLTVIGYYSMAVLAAYLALTALSALWMSHFWEKRKSLDYENFRIAAKNQNKLYEMMNGITDIKINAYSQYKIEEWQRMQEERYRMGKKVLRLGQIQETGYAMIGQIRNILITYWIAAEVVDGNLTLGTDDEHFHHNRSGKRTFGTTHRFLAAVSGRKDKS